MLAMEYCHKWKTVATPGGRMIRKLAASGRRTSGRGCTGLPTVDASSAIGGRISKDPAAKIRPSGAKKAITINDAVRLCGWGSPRASDGTNGGPNQDDKAEIPPQAAMLAGWTTPQAHDRSPRGQGQKAKHGTKHGYADLNGDAMLAGWGTPRANDAEKRGEIAADIRNGLAGDALLTGWATMTARDMRCEHGSPETMERRQNRTEGKPLSKEVLGTTLKSSPCATGHSGVLNAAHSRWLMGFPEAWDKASPNYEAWLAVQEQIASGACEATGTP